MSRLGVEDSIRSAMRLRVSGTVQGVGFRPFVYRLAEEHGLGGWVRNTGAGVEIEVEGTAADLEVFVRRLRVEAPPLARVEQLDTESQLPAGATAFAIRASVTQVASRQTVSPDMAVCPQCEQELFDPSNRRYRYPFITCTDCGPRFTLIESLPYDRERTTMRVFEMCAECRREYHDPADRRFHSETNCCFRCGPRLWLEDAVFGNGSSVLGGGGCAESPASEDPILTAAAMLIGGGILALRGLGGFHLAADAGNESAVLRLRLRKGREAKPFAVMVRTMAQARMLGEIGAVEAVLLSGPERPVVLLHRHADAPLSPSVAPGLDTVGVMLAYTPLHQLLLDVVGRPLVMTSGNRSDEPIAIANVRARERLAGIADAFLLHDRQIVARYDDSVTRVAEGEPLTLRRSRGFAPLPLALPIRCPVPLVAVGPQLKNTFTLGVESRAYVSPHIGDLDDVETLEHFEDALGRYRELFDVAPMVAVRDRHPDYLSTRIAEQLGLPKVLAVQHHHAHVAAVMAEHAVTTPVVGIAYDGAGYGDDGSIWGAEVLVADLRSYRRAGSLRAAPLPGGDLGARLPWRAALGYLSLDPSLEHFFSGAFTGVDPRELEMARLQVQRAVNAPLASSMGRLFDAAAAVLGLRKTALYEGQAAMELEALAGSRIARAVDWPIAKERGMWLMDPVPLLAELGRRRRNGQDTGMLAAVFHESVAAQTARIALRVCDENELRTVALGGGVFQNARLLAGVKRRLRDRGVQVLVPRQLSPNDGAISYGQAAVAAAVLEQEALCA